MDDMRLFRDLVRARELELRQVMRVRELKRKKKKPES